MDLSIKLGSGASEKGSVELLPLRLLVMADFAGTTVTESDPFEIGDAAGLDGAFGRLAPRLFFQVKDLLSGTDRPLTVDLEPRSIKDFTPQTLLETQAVLRRVATLVNSLSELPPGQAGEDALAKLAAECTDLPALSALLVAGTPAVLPAAGAAVMPAPSSAVVPAGGGESAGSEGVSIDLLQIARASAEPEKSKQKRASSAIGSLINKIGKNSAAKAKQGGGHPQVVERVSRLLHAQLDEVYHHPRWQSAEAAWRGLELLVKNSNFRSGVRVLVGHADRPALVGCLATVLKDVRASVVIAPGQYDDPTLHADSLEALAELGEAQQVVVVTSLAPGFLGLGAGDEAAQMPYARTLIEQPQYTKWRSLCSKDSARWLCVTFNRVLLRPPWGKQKRRDPSGYRETVRANLDYLWGDTALIVGALIAQSFASTGWTTEIIGRNWRIEDLAIRPWRRDSGREVQLALEARIPTQQVDDLAKSGILSPVSGDNSDSVELIKAPTLAGLMHDGRPALPYQLAAGRLAEAIALYLDRFEGGDLANGLQAYLAELVAGTGVGAHASVRQKGNRLDVDVGTGGGVLRGVRFGFSFSV